jgi:CheY-like chemotaxis protein
MNLAVNARDAMPAGGTITLRTSDADRADRVILTVEDDGVGMDPATRARAFEPFFTTKASAKGTGLGLSTVYGIVTRAGGDIELDTAPGKGTRFRLTLPRAESDPVTSEGEPEEPAGSVPADRTASILLVEDEASVRRLVRRVLRRDGHTVREAEDAADALRILDDFRPDLLLTDVVLPSGAGPELADEVDRRVPGVAVVLMSGYLEEEIRANGAGNGSRRFLSKPFSPADLRTTVARALA